ncbi:MAG: tRNA-dihydrouridine synthase family protein, partial [Candidatus Shapirobacteria bacterium]|nr:tRNA-dihydrouridine synthase family protein [Candidatus Shapirobacteria bacterium]
HSQKIVGLSPMDGITDEAFRLTQCEIAKPDLIFTEFVSAEGLAHSAVKLFDTLLFSKEERPIIGQLFGKDPDSFYLAAVILCHLGFDGIDINFGCPAKTVTQHGSGASLIDKPELASQIIKSVQKAISDFASSKVTIKDLKLKEKALKVIDRNLIYSSPLVKEGLGEIVIPTISVKTRIGISTDTTDTWIPFLLSHRLDFLTLHGRTLKQGYSGLSDWDAIARAAKLTKKANTPIFGNGDVQSRAQALEYCQKYGVDGVLIGRGAMGNPWAFNDEKPEFKEKFKAMLLHAKNFTQVFPTRRFDPLRRHFLLYVSGHPQAKQLRGEIVKLTSVDQLYALEERITNW